MGNIEQRFDRLIDRNKSADMNVRHKVLKSLFIKTVTYIHGRPVEQPFIKGGGGATIRFSKRKLGVVLRYKQPGEPGITINSYTQLYMILHFNGELSNV